MAAAARAAQPPEVARQLKIKTNVCTRLAKEVDYYHREAAQNEARVQGMRDAGRDPYDIKKQEEVLGESYMMIPDSTKRHGASLEDLQRFLEEHADDPAIVGTEQLAAAQEILRAQNMAEGAPGVDATTATAAAAATAAPATATDGAAPAEPGAEGAAGGTAQEEYQEGEIF